MKNKVKVIIPIFALICMIGFICYGYYKDKMFLPKNNLWNNNNSSTEQKNVSSVEGNDKENISVVDNPDFKVGLNTPIEAYKLNFTANSVEMTKQLNKKFPKPNVYLNGSEFKFDNDGNITNEYSYYTVNLTIKNSTNEKIDYWLNSFGLLAKDQDLKKIYTMQSEVFLCDKDNFEAKNYFQNSFEPNSEKNVTIGFIIKDEDFEKTPHVELIINQSGSADDKNTSMRFIKLK